MFLIYSCLLISPADEYLLSATRKLTIEELHQHAQDARLLYHEFWVRILIFYEIGKKNTFYSLQTIPTNHLEKLRICGAGTKNRYGTIIASKSSLIILCVNISINYII